MPVVVVQAESRLGHAIVGVLLGLGAEVEVRATVGSVAERRWFLDRGVPVAVTELDDAELLAAVFAGAHTVVLLPGSVSGSASGAESGAESGYAEVVAEALDGSDVRRVVTVGFAAPLSAVPGVEVCFVAEDPHLGATVAAVLAADARA